MRLLLAALVTLWTSPLQAATPADALRERIIAMDQPAVAQALTAAVAEDAADPKVEPVLQRALFSVFAETHPRNDRFTARWLQDAPEDPLAQTARAWHLTAPGWSQRGADSADRTPEPAFAALQGLHRQAYLLFDRAANAAPHLLAASDGRLVLATTVVSADTIPPEIERIMALHPNRGSLMRAMSALAPHWGGAPHQIVLLCDRHAPRVRTIPGYDSAICQVDAVFDAGVRSGPLHDRALAALPGLTHPVLDPARRIAALSGVGDPAARAATLTALAAARPLTAEEALALDTAQGEISGSFGYVAYLPALAGGIAGLRRTADNDPLNTVAVVDYITQSQANDAENRVAFDRLDAIGRLQTLLRAIPHDWRAWAKLAELLRQTAACRACRREIATTTPRCTFPAITRMCCACGSPACPARC